MQGKHMALDIVLMSFRDAIRLNLDLSFSKFFKQPLF